MTPGHNTHPLAHMVMTMPTSSAVTLEGVMGTLSSFSTVFRNSMHSCMSGDRAQALYKQEATRGAQFRRLFCIPDIVSAT